MYDYSGHDIDDLLDAITSTRLHGTLDKLYTIIKEHNIPLEGIELPPYLYAEDKPVPVGFTIPRGDKDIKAVEDAIKLLKDIQDRMMDPQDVDFDNVTQKITALEKLFTVEGNGDGDGE